MSWLSLLAAAALIALIWHDGLEEAHGTCEICGTRSARLVTDHSHVTGNVRGRLCELCNSWLGVYERNVNDGRLRGRHLYRNWALTFQPAILAYLTKPDSGKLYYRRNQPPLQNNPWRLS